MAIERILYATGNAGKVKEISALLEHHGIKTISPYDLESTNKEPLDVPENASSLEGNATQKVKAYIPHAGGLIVVADDTGLEIDALNGEPGIHVRRWIGRRMEDEEIIAYALERLTGVPDKKRTARFRSIVALGKPDGTVELFEGTLEGKILEKASNIRVEGFPFESLFFSTEWNMLLGEQHSLPVAQKEKMLNHRERALEKAVARLKEL